MKVENENRIVFDKRECEILLHILQKEVAINNDEWLDLLTEQSAAIRMNAEDDKKVVKFLIQRNTERRNFLSKAVDALIQVTSD